MSRLRIWPIRPTHIALIVYNVLLATTPEIVNLPSDPPLPSSRNRQHHCPYDVTALIVTSLPS